MSTKKDSGLVVSGSLVKKIGESLGLVKLILARKLQSLVSTYQRNIDKINNIARYNLNDTKYRQKAFRSA